jgi:hypothetical protein
VRSGPAGTLYENDPSRAVCTELSIAALGGPPSVVMRTRAPRIGTVPQCTLLLTVPNQLGVDYNAHLLETIAREIAPALGWAPKDESRARN